MNVVEAELKSVFGGSADEAATRIATSWSWHQDRKTIMPGTGQTFIIRAGSVNRFYRLEYAIAYSHDYTMQRWPKSRGLEIAELDTADVIGYKFHQSVLPFVKVGDYGNAANIQLATFRELDKFGEPIPGEEEEITIRSAKLSELIGLRHQGRAFITPVDLRGNRALLLATGSRQMSPEELKRIEEDLLSELL